MKIGISAWSFPANITIPQGLKIAKRAGFDAVELSMSGDGYLTPASAETDVVNFRRAADNMSLELRSLATGLFGQYPFTSNDPDIAARGKEIARRGLKMAKWLGADTLLVVPGVVTADVPYDVAYIRALDVIRELAEDAGKLQVSIGIENVWSKFLLSPLEMRRFVDEVGSPSVGVYFDAGNVLINGYPQHWIKILGSRIKKVHVKDFRVAVGNSHGFTNILEGDMDWYAVRDALRDVGYDDVVTAEISGYRTLPEIGLRHAGESLKRIFRM